MELNTSSSSVDEQLGCFSTLGIFLFDSCSTLVPLSFHSQSSFLRTLFGPRSGVFRSSSERGPKEVRTRDEREYTETGTRVEGNQT